MTIESQAHSIPSPAI